MSEELTRVKVMHPTQNNTVDVDIPDDMTVNDIIQELVEAEFINASPQGYQAVLKDGPEAINMDLNKTLAEDGASNNSTIRLISVIPAGC